MKKIISILMGVVFIFSFTACTDDTGESKDSEGANAEFHVTADKTEIKGETDQVTVTVEATAKKNVTVTIPSNKGIEDGAVWFECYTLLDGEEYALYNNYYGIDFIMGYFEYNMQKGEKSARTMQFSRFPVKYSDETTKVMPKGEYKVRVKLNGESTWTETDIVINAK